MANLIGTIYQPIRELGAGGGGIVYLARHMRLGKDVILKWSRKTVTPRNIEKMRREVDILKELHHSRIPQVYDHFIENGHTITVIDYIEGESLDKALAREGQFSQPQVIDWAKQILSALIYLHSPTHGDPPRGYVHSDIKPQNIMIRPDKELCLIDFNISLAIGESTAGRSPGYSPPEQYLAPPPDMFLNTFANNEQNAEPYKTTIQSRSIDDDVTVMDDDISNEATFLSETRSSQNLSAPNPQYSGYMLPDARSDIYSLGATLYHLLTGIRPHSDARSVIPLSEEQFSKPLVDIITKAMKPELEDRFQTAQEMLDALDSLHENDPRTKKLHRQRIVSAAAALVFMAAGLFTAIVGAIRINNIKSSDLNAGNSEAALRSADVKSAVQYALDGLPDKNALFAPEYLPSAQKALADALGVYEASDGYQNLFKIELPSSPFFIRSSTDGKITAVICKNSVCIIDTQTGTIKAELPTLGLSQCEVEFIDDTRIVYAGEEGLVCYDTELDKKLWTGEKATAIAVSGDGKKVLAVYLEDTFGTLYDTETGSSEKVFFSEDGEEHKDDADKTVFHHQPQPKSETFYNFDYDLLELNYDGTLAAVSYEDGSLVCIVLKQPSGKDFYPIDFFSADETAQLLGNKTDPDSDPQVFFYGGFINNTLAVTALTQNNSQARIFDFNVIMEDQTDNENYEAVTKNSEDNMHIFIVPQGSIIYRHSGKQLYSVDHSTGNPLTKLLDCEDTIQTFDTDNNHIIISTKDEVLLYDHEGSLLGRFDETTDRNLCTVRKKTAVYGVKGSSTLRVLNFVEKGDTLVDLPPPKADDRHETRISADEKYIMRFDFESFTIFDSEGTFICRKSFEDPDTKVYDTIYRREDDLSYLMVIYENGKRVCYSSINGDVISEDEVDPPNTSQGSDLETAKYIIKKSPEQTAEVYDKKSGLIKKLDCKVGYVYENGDNIILYVRENDMKNTRGIILDDSLAEIGQIPNFCDYYNGTIYAENTNGSVKRFKILDIDELIDIAERKLEEWK